MATEHSIRLTGDNTKLKKILKESDKLLKNNARMTGEYGKILSKSFDQVNKKVKDLNKSLAQMGSSLGSGAGGGAGGLLSKLKALTGLGMAGVVGAGVFAGAAIRQRMQTAGTGLQLQAFGAGGGFRSNTGLGFSAQQTLGQRSSLVRGIGGTGAGLEQIQALARVTGLDAEQIISSTSARRATGTSGGGSVTAIRRTMGILSETLGETFDKGRLGEFMSSIDSTLMTIGAGVNIDEKSFVQAFSNLVKNPTLGADPRRAAGALGAVDNAFKTASGNNFGLIAKIMAGAIGPGASPLDIMFESRRGLFAQGNLGGKDRTSSIFSSMRDFFIQSELGGTDPRSSKLRALTIQDKFGVQGADVAREFGNAIMGGNIGRATKLAQGFEGPQSVQEKALEIMQSTDGTIVSIESLMGNLLDQVGDVLIPNLIKITQHLTGSPAKLADAFLGGPGFGSRIDKETINQDKARALSFVKRMELPGFGSLDASSEQVGSLFRQLGTDRFNQDEKMRIGSALQKEIQEGKGLLNTTTNASDKEALIQMIEKLERFVKTLENMEKKNSNITVVGPRGRTESISTKTFGQVRN